MKRVLVLDLDDTLYEEMTYVRSAFRAVARWGEERHRLPREESFATMLALLEANGRGRVFDDWLAGRGGVREALAVYRHHRPEIALWPDADRLLAERPGSPTYIVTDGHKGVQARKIDALGLRPRVRGVYLTNQYGRHRAKPSPFCFELIARRERVSMDRLVHVGDNPSKDFIGLNPLGVTTVRVLTGQHAHVTAEPRADAQHRIDSLARLPDVLQQLDAADSGPSSE